MKNGKFAARRSSGSKKVFAVILAALLLVGCSVGATLAWLTATTNKVENTFTVGKVEITLQEHQYVEDSNSLGTELVTSNTYKLIPGKNMPKDPFVTVKANSEPCYVFVCIKEEYNSLGTTGANNRCVLYAENNSLSGGVWNSIATEAFAAKYKFVDGYTYLCCEVGASTDDQDLYILLPDDTCTDTSHKNGCVTVNSDLTASVTTAPTLTFSAAAIQKDGFANSEAAFEALPEAFKVGVTLKTVTP